MITLPHGCRCSEISVSPKNWKSPKASIKKNWRIWYRFYDPNFSHIKMYKKGKLCTAKSGINFLKTREERVEMAKAIIAAELDLLKNEGYNPITGKYNPPPKLVTEFEISPKTNFITALYSAFEKLNKSEEIISNVKSALNFIRPSVIKMNLDKLEIESVRTRHLKLLLEHVGENKKGKWSAQSFNHYRSYIRMLFDVLVDYGATDFNYVTAIKKKPVPIKPRRIPTIEERIKIDEYFAKVNPDFRRFMHIFFHSGGREIELLRLKKQDVVLAEQYVKIEVRKGQVTTIQNRPIKNIAMPYWIELISMASANQYLFNLNFIPGDKQCLRDRLTKYWQYHVKKKLGIDVDLYSLKHANLDETAALLDAAAAAAQAGHTTPVITIKHYLVNEQERKNKRLRDVANSFTGLEDNDKFNEWEKWL